MANSSGDVPTAAEKKRIRAKTLQAHRDEMEDYAETVRGLYALAISASWDESARRVRPESRWCVPRRMDRVPEEAQPDANPPTSARPGGTVTPDAVIQVLPTYGLVAEMKKNFSTERPAEVFEQIAGYDGELIGWWTQNERIDSHDLVLLTHLASSVRARDAYQAWQGEGNRFRRSFAIVEFSYTSQGQLWYLLRRVDGRLSDSVHDEQLRLGKHISNRILIDLFSKWKFSEQEPPLMYMLLLIHDYVLPLFPSEMEFEKETGGKYPSVEVTLGALRDELARQFCPAPSDQRFFSLPRVDWVSRAVDQLVRIGLAYPLVVNGGRREAESSRRLFHFSLRKPRQKDTLEYFTDRALQLEWDAASSRPPAQPSLFSEPDEPRKPSA